MLGSGAQWDKYKTVLLLRRFGGDRKQLIEHEHLISVTCDRYTCTVESENLKQIFLGEVVVFCYLSYFTWFHIVGLQHLFIYLIQVTVLLCKADIRGSADVRLNSEHPSLVIQMLYVPPCVPPRLPYIPVIQGDIDYDWLSSVCLILFAALFQQHLFINWLMGKLICIILHTMWLMLIIY